MNNELPQTLLNYNNIVLICNNNANVNIKINKILNDTLNELKIEINFFGDQWDIYKKYTNPYEYIHSNYTNKSLCKLKPLSRSFYKMIEIINCLCPQPTSTSHTGPESDLCVFYDLFQLQD